ncbi:type IX secretion system protein PorQ [uncultured Hymenobacter sp.]|uniref:type IX secretion system protein PorQ n=1 Tax=uncultured Hymenobacter sp. TaxID=170016 RepID=UPI0035C97862
MKQRYARWLTGFGLMMGVGSWQTALAQQLGGRAAFPFLELPAGAQQAALGGMAPAARADDPTLLFANPAALHEGMDGRLALSYVDYVSDIRQSTAAYVFNTAKAGRFGVGLTYVSYGDFESFDAAGNSLGSFSVNEFALSVADSYTKGRVTFGGAAKLAVSSIAGSRAVGLAADVGALYKHPAQDFTVGLVVRNAGAQLTPYPGTRRGPLPLDVQLGAAIKPEHMPVRVSLTAHHLQRWDIEYFDPNQRGPLDEAGNETTPKRSFGDNLARHFTVGAELLLGQNLSFRAGYNHLARRELRLDNVSGGAGLSLGVMLKISQFQLDYTYATLQAAGSSNYFTLSKTLFKKKE